MRSTQDMYDDAPCRVGLVQVGRHGVTKSSLDIYVDAKSPTTYLIDGECSCQSLPLLGVLGRAIGSLRTCGCVSFTPRVH